MPSSRRPRQPPATETITIAYSGDANDQPSSVEFPLTVGQAAATLGLSDLNFTYDGSPHAAVVTTSPAGLSGVTVTYAQNGVAVTNPTQAGDYTVTATLDNPNYTATAVTGTLVIGQATPTLTWADPGEHHRRVLHWAPPSSTRSPPSTACRCRVC